MSNLQSPPGFRRRLLRAQRVGRFALLGVVIAGFLGAFGGGGVLSQKRVVVGDHGSISVPRFVRIQTPFTLVAERAGTGTQPWRLQLSERFLRDLSIEHLSPTPRAMHRSDAGLVLEFAPGTTRASMRARSDAAGRGGGPVRMDDGEARDVPLWTYP